MDYGYVNARIRGMKGRLLDRKALDELVLKPDIDSLTSALEKTPYKDDVESAGVKYAAFTGWSMRYGEISLALSIRYWAWSRAMTRRTTSWSFCGNGTCRTSRRY